VLRYYKDDAEARNAKTGGAIEIDFSVNVSKGSSIDPDHPYYFEISTESRTYALCAPSAEDLEGWLVALGAEKGVGGEAGERRESAGSMASFIASGPLVEVHSGWMKKKGQGMSLLGGKMQKRYFVLYDNRELHYFEGSSMDNIVRKGRIHLQQARSPRDQREVARKMPPRSRSEPPTIAI